MPSSNGYGGALQPLAIDEMPLNVAPPRGSRFGSPLVLFARLRAPPALA
jgi:hypothetical protein